MTQADRFRIGIDLLMMFGCVVWFIWCVLQYIEARKRERRRGEPAAPSDDDVH
jgi:hypothetical protein